MKELDIGPPDAVPEGAECTPVGCAQNDSHYAVNSLRDVLNQSLAGTRFDSPHLRVQAVSEYLPTLSPKLEEEVWFQ